MVGRETGTTCIFHLGLTNDSLTWKSYLHATSIQYTPQLLYNTIVGVQAKFRVSYPNRVISRVKCIDYIRKGVLNTNLVSNPDLCYMYFEQCYKEVQMLIHL